MRQSAFKFDPHIASRENVTCESACGPDADRHTKLLINREAEGSLLEAYLRIRKVGARS